MAETALPRDIVLLVDDSPETLGFLTEALEKSGFSVLIATAGQSALNIVERITPDLILLDAVMPGMDGFETCRKLKTNGAVAQVPVIFMTGLTETEHVVNALDSGGVDYLTKPINIDELRARIRVHLSNARSAQSARVALDAAGRHLLAVKASGAIHWSTPQATRLINAATNSDDGLDIVSRRISTWMAERDKPGFARDVAFALVQNGQASLQFSFLGAIGADEHLFRLTAANKRPDDEVLRQHFPVTQRESEVLLWIAKGKSNRDIGDILGLSARTVNKHLEQIYVKLGVENRASAAVKAAHVLHGEERSA
ncbi:Two-component transcriptional regulator, CheY-LuxR families (Two-component signal transduction system) [Neorhizobium galegae bv. officinalis bv. officinalis str. HAMBI 1141]|uniref:Two-component transcriptional regulator, CheY-LuxR families (Two-component signal transduction system) n=1 Tax=Neorhizobium galegae bv. officinalis bv. officinalis str. HAMBI 1141 TaxID=1028801 RepID=A0A068TCJ8_NEOGA|nr:response regulator transcription factor [Neorhizobium galegae]CDN55085.1 Two-component transcriptional regulator, CheY-LuxR families (Two-component signal transduction system) [Neorhizobium galegae bv. officinalis bv. officinalis str. HAMBI 1141]